jgi:hypothetical protein
VICRDLDSCQPRRRHRRRSPPPPGPRESGRRGGPKGVVIPPLSGAMYRFKLTPSIAPASRFRFRPFPTCAPSFVSPEGRADIGILLRVCLCVAVSLRMSFPHRLHPARFLRSTSDSDANSPVCFILSSGLSAPPVTYAAQAPSPPFIFTDTRHPPPHAHTKTTFAFSCFCPPALACVCAHELSAPVCLRVCITVAAPEERSLYGTQCK